jgi:hypothetical protein
MQGAQGIGPKWIYLIDLASALSEFTPKGSLRLTIYWQRQKEVFLRRLEVFTLYLWNVFFHIQCWRFYAHLDVFWGEVPSLSDMFALFQRSDKAVRSLARWLDDIGPSLAMSPH